MEFFLQILLEPFSLLSSLFRQVRRDVAQVSTDLFLINPNQIDKKLINWFLQAQTHSEGERTKDYNTTGENT